MGPKIWLSSPHMGGKEKDFVDEAFADKLDRTIRAPM